MGKKQFEQHRENGDLDDDEDEDEDPDMGHDVMGAAAASAASEGNGMMPPPTPSMAHSTLRSETPGFKGVRLHHRAVSGRGGERVGVREKGRCGIGGGEGRRE